MIIDTHVHLDDTRYNDLNNVLSRARAGGVKRFIIPGADPKTLDIAVDIAQQNNDVYFAVGVHPYDLKAFDKLNFINYINQKKCIAIGECGLDYFRLDGSEDKKNIIKQKQREVFIAQIRLAKKYRKPLIIHIREASNDAKQILLDEKASQIGGVLHCFNADEQLLSLADEGFYFGIGGVITFKNAKKLVKILPKIPKDKLLIETDAPYLTPVPHRGERNEPLYTNFVVQKISDLLSIPVKEIEQLTTQNADKLFHIL